MTEKESNVLNLINDKVDEVKNEIIQINKKMDEYIERVVILESQQKFIEGTFKQYKEDIKIMFDNMFEKIREVVHNIQEEKNEIKEWCLQEVKNSSKDNKIWVMASVLGFMMSAGFALLAFFK